MQEKRRKNPLWIYFPADQTDITKSVYDTTVNHFRLQLTICSHWSSGLASQKKHEYENIKFFAFSHSVVDTHVSLGLLSWLMSPPLLNFKPWTAALKFPCKISSCNFQFIVPWWWLQVQAPRYQSSSRMMHSTIVHSQAEGFCVVVQCLFPPSKQTGLQSKKVKFYFTGWWIMQMIFWKDLYTIF